MRQIVDEIEQLQCVNQDLEQQLSKAEEQTEEYRKLVPQLEYKNNFIQKQVDEHQGIVEEYNRVQQDLKN